MSDKLISQNIRKIVAIVVMVSMSACSAARPNARIFNQTPDGAPSLYQQGWKDGCESGMAMVGNQLYKVVYKNTVNPQLVNNTQYYRGWSEARIYCAHYTMANLWEGGVLQKSVIDEERAYESPTNVFSVAASWSKRRIFY